MKFGGGYNGEPSIFDNISKDDLIIAFFPCTMFNQNNRVLFKTQSIQFRNWNDKQKIEYVMKRNITRCEFYDLLCKIILIAINRGLRMIIENPYSQPHYLTEYFPLTPKITDKNRKLKGDYYSKPTQYFFINCEPETNLILEPQEQLSDYANINNANKNVKRMGVKNRQAARSMIHQNYANRFIREQLLEEE